MNNKDLEKGSEAVVPDDNFKGYTLAELRYQRALLLVKREFLREKAIKQAKSVKKQIPIINGKSPLSGITTHGVLGRVIGGLNFADYLIIGFQALRIGKKIGGLFRKK